MPAVRKPTAVLVAAGAGKNHPERLRARAGEPDTGRGIGPAPDHLTAAQRAVWDEIVSDCAPGVFQSSDRSMLAGFAMLEAEMREDPASFGGRKWSAWLALLSRCGMTPADRSRVRVQQQDEGAKPKHGLASFL